MASGCRRPAWRAGAAVTFVGRRVAQRRLDQVTVTQLLDDRADGLRVDVEQLGHGDPGPGRVGDVGLQLGERDGGARRGPDGDSRARRPADTEEHWPP